MTQPVKYSANASRSRPTSPRSSVRHRHRNRASAGASTAVPRRTVTSMLAVLSVGSVPGAYSARTPTNRTARRCVNSSSTAIAAVANSSGSAVGPASLRLCIRVVNGTYRILTHTRMAARPSAAMSAMSCRAISATSRPTSDHSTRSRWKVVSRLRERAYPW